MKTVRDLINKNIFIHPGKKYTHVEIDLYPIRDLVWFGEGALRRAYEFARTLPLKKSGSGYYFGPGSIEITTVKQRAPNVVDFLRALAYEEVAQWLDLPADVFEKMCFEADMKWRTGYLIPPNRPVGFSCTPAVLRRFSWEARG
jgi:hypothetical protein